MKSTEFDGCCTRVTVGGGLLRSNIGREVLTCKYRYMYGIAINKNPIFRIGKCSLSVKPSSLVYKRLLLSTLKKSALNYIINNVTIGIVLHATASLTNE